MEEQDVDVNAINLQHREDDGTLLERSAPSFLIPSVRIVEVEHPFIIQNFDRALKSLGGEAQIKQASIQIYRLERLPNQTNGNQIFDRSEAADGADDSMSAPTTTLGLSLRPNDPFAKRTSSTVVSTNNILFKVTVPKRTGRKRKRGFDEPFRDSPSSPIGINNTAAADLVDRLRDHSERYQLQAVGTIHQTHRFRNAPDLQMCAAELPIMREVRDHVMQPNYESFKQFQISLKTGSSGVTAFPAPPAFLPSGPHFQYGYQQHREPIRSRQKPLLMPHADNAPVPDRPPTSLPEIYTKGVENALPLLTALLRDRPIITLHVAIGELRRTPQQQIEVALLYLTYYADIGPWKGAYIKYGVDPRKDAAYRVYQTIYTGIWLSKPQHQQQQAQQEEQEEQSDGEYEPQNRKRKPKRVPKPRDASGIKSYIFNFPDKRTSSTSIQPHFIPFYQLCDISVPFLQPLIHKASRLSGICDSRKSGWYTSPALAQVQVLLREMVSTTTTTNPSQNIQRQREQEWKIIVDLSDKQIIEDQTETILPNNQGSESIDKTYISQLIQNIRTIATQEPERYPVGRTDRQRRKRVLLGTSSNVAGTDPGANEENSSTPIASTAVTVQDDFEIEDYHNAAENEVDDGDDAGDDEEEDEAESDGSNDDNDDDGGEDEE